MKRFGLIVPTLSIILPFILLSCEGPEGPSGPEGPAIPVINTIIADPFTCEPADTVDITVTYTYAGNSTITISWAADNGTIVLTSNDQEITWVAPETAGWYRVDVDITDGEREARGHVIIEVEGDFSICGSENGIFPLITDFDDSNYGIFEVAGRQQGVNSIDFFDYEGGLAVHLHHEDFTEIRLQKMAYVNDLTDLHVEADLKLFATSTAGPTSDFYAIAAVGISFYDSSDSWLGNVSYGYSTSTYPVNAHPDDYYLELTTNTDWHHVNLDIESMMSNASTLYSNREQICHVYFDFVAYASGWPYNMQADLWIDNINIHR